MSWFYLKMIIIFKLNLQSHRKKKIYYRYAKIRVMPINVMWDFKGKGQDPFILTVVGIISRDGDTYWGWFIWFCVISFWFGFATHLGGGFGGIFYYSIKILIGYKKFVLKLIKLQGQHFKSSRWKCHKILRT